VSVFRPARRVTGPDGREWEIYAYRIRLPQRRKLRRFPVDVAAAALRALRTNEWTIEAIAFIPRETCTWRTTTEHRGQVLALVEGHLARGHVPQRLANATYLGCRRSAR
jgi:hypothetical protein